MDEKISKLFIKLVDKLYNTEPAGEPFRKPVDVVKYGCFDYYLYVKHPIDLSTIRDKLTNHQYKDAWRFVADIQLMLSNAYLFNKKGTPVYEFTNKLSRIWSADYPPIMNKLNYCCGILHKFGPQLLFCHGTTQDRYCQIAIGAKYKCYQDQYSYCIPCFNRFCTDFITIQSSYSTCEKTLMKLPTHPIHKSEFQDRTNDHWQYESFVECTQCTRRVHEICEVYPADEQEIKACKQHDQIEEEQRTLCQVPPEYRLIEDQPLSYDEQIQNMSYSDLSSGSIRFETLQSELKPSLESLTEKLPIDQSINEFETEGNTLEKRFVCNNCYVNSKIGIDLRHRKYSARRLPQTRMSRYIETKVNEYIRANAPCAGEVTIRVLTAYRDKVAVKPEMRSYINRNKERNTNHPFLADYPNEFNYTNRAIFAWQEIDGVDVCVFGMHVQEYGQDCPEPNRQVVYLSYLDSVHFFRPKSVRTGAYHEILLSYFKYVRKLGFRRIFIWVCPSRKGDDYIFYRHPIEQKMPTLRRLADWYINLLDKGILAGIVESHQSIHQFANSQKLISLLSMPYLSGDYWPGEFERLLKIMIESQETYNKKMVERRKLDEDVEIITFEKEQLTPNNHHDSLYAGNQASNFRNEIMSQPSDSRDFFGGMFNSSPNHNFEAFFNNEAIFRLLQSAASSSPAASSPNYEHSNIKSNESAISYEMFTPNSQRSDSDQPLDLSTTSPEIDSDKDVIIISEIGTQNSSDRTMVNRRKKRKFDSMNCTPKRRDHLTARQNSSQSSNNLKGYGPDRNKSRACNQSQKGCSLSPETLCDPEEEMMRTLDKLLKRQRDGFIVARLNDCDCSPHFESQRLKEEAIFTCDLMRGREPFLQLARLKNWEFSTLRRAKFSSLAMVKHLGQFFKLEPICNECFSFDQSKCYYSCNDCNDFYLCTSCSEHTDHGHQMRLVDSPSLPEIDEFLQPCSIVSAANSLRCISHN